MQGGGGLNIMQGGGGMGDNSKEEEETRAQEEEEEQVTLAVTDIDRLEPAEPLEVARNGAVHARPSTQKCAH